MADSPVSSDVMARSERSARDKGSKRTKKPPTTPHKQIGHLQAPETDSVPDSSHDGKISKFTKVYNYFISMFYLFIYSFLFLFIIYSLSILLLFIPL